MEYSNLILLFNGVLEDRAKLSSNTPKRALVSNRLAEEAFWPVSELCSLILLTAEVVACLDFLGIFTSFISSFHQLSSYKIPFQQHKISNKEKI